MLNIVTLFSGYDSQCLALNRLGLPYELTAWCEIDKHAITAHNALFPQWQDRNLGDVSKVDWTEWHKQHPQQIDLLTYSSPCQDFSSAGLQRGGEEGSGTRSGLLWETEKAVQELRPRYLVFENVGGLVSDKFIDLFNRWQARLNGYGYTNFSQLMNAKDYGVPQNRLRIFMVSVLDCQRAYYFPKPFKLERRLKDVLEQNVDERYYLKDEQVQKLMAGLDREMVPQSGRVYSVEGISPTLDASAPDHNRRVQIAEPQMLGWTRNEKGEITDRHPVNVANCVTAAKRDNTQNYVIEPCIYGLPHGHYKGDIYTDYAPTVKSSAYAANNPLIEPCIAAMRGRDKDNPNYRGKSNDNYAQRLELKTDGTSNTLTSVAKDNLLIEPQIHDADDIPFDDGKGGIIWAKYESEEYERLMNEYWEKEWEKYKQRGIQLTLGENEPTIIEDFYGTVREPRVYTGEAPTLRADRTGLLTIENADGGNDMVIGSMQKHAYVGSVDDVAPCVNAACGMGGGQRPMVTEHNIRIRRLTERELYRLMDLDESDINMLLAAPIPCTQHAKLAGNSIVLACLYYIFRNIFVDTEPAAGTQTTLF